MNRYLQSKKERPNAKLHIWCKNFDKCFDENCCFGELTHRQHLKMLRENDIRYCKKYRFSKQSFNQWKKDYRKYKETGIA
jgi:hypothetical protein